MNEIKTTINEQLRQLQMFTHRAAFNHFGGSHNPHRGQGRVLALLKLKPEISQKELTYLLNMSKQAAAELIGKLEKSGYVTRTPSKEDKRVMMIQLTTEGTKAVSDTAEDTPKTDDILDCLTEEEQVSFSGYLERIIKQYEERFPQEDFEQRRRMMKDFMSSHGPDFNGHRHMHGHHHGECRHDHNHYDFKKEGFDKYDK